MKKWFRQYVLNRKWMCRYILILFVLSLIPMLLIARYDHPCADDFSYGNHTVPTWRETGSIIQTIIAAINGTKHVYNTWQGSFSAVFLMTLHPAIFSERLYMLVPIILILGLVAATMLLLKVILMDYLKADRYAYGIIAIIVTFLSLQFVFSPVQAFYWYNGAMYYTGFYALSMLAFSVILLAIKNSKVSMGIIYAVFTFILSFLIGSSNFVTALTSSVVMVLFFLYRLIVKRNKWLIPLLGLIAICAALSISAFAPGNTVRQAHFQGMNPIKAITLSFWYAIDFVIYAVPVPVYFAFACITPLIYKTVCNSEFTFRLPGAATALLYGVYASTFTPNLYAMSSFGPERVVNVNYYAFLLFFLLALIYWCGWIAKKMTVPASMAKGKKKLLRKDRSIEPSVIGVLMVCLIFSCIVISDVNVNAMTSISALRSLAAGEAKLYHEENLSRLAVYTNPDVLQVEVPAFTVRPYVLYFDDITSDPIDWRNIALASYYNKETVTLTK